MFKSLSVFKHNNAPVFIGDLDACRFSPCSPSADKSLGFVAPRGEHEHLAENVGNGTLIAIMIETKSVPAAAIQRELDKAVVAIEQTTGRKPGKKERASLKEEIRAQLLPAAFPKQTKVYVWLSEDGMLFIDNTSASKVDDVLTLLVRTVKDFRVDGLNTKDAPATLMAQMLIDDDDQAESNFIVGRELLLEACDESNAKVKYTNHSLHIEEIRDHIAQGKRPIALSLGVDDVVDFVLTAGLQLKKIKIQDALAIKSTDAASDFDANTLIITGALVPAVKSLVFEMGGEVIKEQADV